MYLQLFLVAMVPVAASSVFYYVAHKPFIAKWPNWLRQAIIGIIFGGFACLGTEYGVDVGGAIANTRDASILCAGLIFGGPAGIIAGLIGGVYRYVAVLWGAGEYTRVACSIACLMAGFISALLRKWIFENRIPGWIMGFFVGVVLEAFHINLLFLTNMADLNKTVGIIKVLTVPMFICNGAAVSLALIAATLIGRKRLFSKYSKETTTILVSVQRWLFTVVIIAFILTSGFTFILQSDSCIHTVTRQLETSIDDVMSDVDDASDLNLLTISRVVCAEVEQTETISTESLRRIAEWNDVAEINLVDHNNMIYASTYPDFIGYDMGSGVQSCEFSVLLDQETEYAQPYQPISYNQTMSRKYAGVRSDRLGGYIQVGYDASQFHQDLDMRVEAASRNKHIDKTGGIVVVGETNILCSEKLDELNLEPDSCKNLISGHSSYELYTVELKGAQYYTMYDATEGYYIIALYPVEEATFNRDVALYLTCFLEIMIFAVLFVLIYMLVKLKVVNNVQKVNARLAEITDGNLNVVVDVRDSQEFYSLSDDINATVDTLKRYIQEASDRINAELEYARNIQASALPHLEPNFVNRKDFDIFATMNPAKEVGGDFYDFYMLDATHLVFTIADVSGKGIPGAMFMMTSKTMIRNIAEMKLPVEEILTLANERLCENNDANMFVTVWLGILDLVTGHVEYANAGHNPACIRRADGEFEMLPTKPGLVLAGMEGMKYRKQEFDLYPGDTLYLYTDGVTEATNGDNELFGNDRMIEGLNRAYEKNSDLKAFLAGVKEEVDSFVQEAPQFDDITMVAIRFKGQNN